ncbi:pectinesterase inhibitor 4-like [Carya illinoinensis]|nr:pectinesterase inhibitor 4-like [Carya illinoinensis]
MAANNTPRHPLSYRHVFMMLLTLLFMSTLQAVLATTNTSQTYEKYIITSCNSTTYPQLCYSSLSPHASKIKANPKKLCKTSLSVGLEAAQNASSIVSKQLKQKGSLTSSETAVIKDCVVNIKNSIDELRESLDAMDKLSGWDKEFQMSNIKTWVSAALTDENTCFDGFEEGQEISEKVKNKVRKRILKVARLTSNAL